MSVTDEIVEARATALVLRATARALRGERGTPRSRMLQAAATLDRIVTIAMGLLKRIEQLEHEVRRPLGGAQ